MSKIIITCDDTASTKTNKILVNPTTFKKPNVVVLKPGDNILTSEMYPELKFGFRPVWFKHNIVMELNPNCQSIVEIDMCGFDASEIRLADRMFVDMTSLRKVNLRGVRFQNAENMDDMFHCCYNLKEIVMDSIETFRSDSLVSADAMFFDAKSIESLGIGRLGGKSLKTIYNIFDGMSSLKKLDISGWNLRGVSIWDPGSYIPMFYRCRNLEQVYVIGCNDFTVKKIETQLNHCDNLFINNIKLIRYPYAFLGAK